MTKTIHKYPFTPRVPHAVIATSIEVHLPVGHWTATFAAQRGIPTLWFELHPDRPAAYVHTYQLFGTGHPIPEGASYQGTVLLENDTLVLHCYLTHIRDL